jgi:transposase-like protein
MLPSITSNTNETTTMDDVLKLLISNGTEAILPVFKTLMNEAMKIERNQAIGAAPYERTSERKGHANGFKDKTINTGIGKITLDIPQARGMSFFPQSLNKGIRSERALKLAIAEMYVNC